MQYLARFIRGSERIGGFGGKSDILARSQVLGNSPMPTAALWRTSPPPLRPSSRHGRSVAVDGVYTLEITHIPSDGRKDSVDRSKLPEPGRPDGAVSRVPAASPWQRTQGHPGRASRDPHGTAEPGP